MNNRSSYLILVAFVVLATIVYMNYSSINDINKKLREYSLSLPRTQNRNQNEESRIKEFYNKIASRERKVYSQNNEDGVIEVLLELVGIKDPSYYVEIGVGSTEAKECNTRYLREVKKWTGLLIDGAWSNPSINLHNEYVMAHTILDIFEKYKVPVEFDLLSEDTDYADYWILESILSRHHPKVIVQEVNEQPPDRCITVPKSDKLIIDDGTEFHGANICAYTCLSKRFGYTMVYCESVGVNCFWIRDDLMENILGFDVSVVQRVLTKEFLWKKPAFAYKKTDKIWHQIVC